jgi:Flp pilus assembly protein TadD
MEKEPKGLARSISLTRKPLTLALLTGAAIVMFAAVSGLSRLYHAQQQALAERWSGRGVADLKAGRYTVAILEFRAALRYDRDNGAYQLSLAQALLGLGRSDEAFAYLINLWERQPENGVVNLELARISVQRKESERALRFYHNSIYATWPGNQEIERNQARLELIDYLLRTGARTQAESELIALAANVDDDPGAQARLGRLFLQVGDSNRALAAFRASLIERPDDPGARAGAGRAAFALHQYALAQRYLSQAVAAAPDDAASAALLATTKEVLELNPFVPWITGTARNRIAVHAFEAAGDRLRSCPALAQVPAGAPGAKPAPANASELARRWDQLKPQITEGDLKRDPDLIDPAMTLSFQIEQAAVGSCGAGDGADQALLLISTLHEEN